MTWLHRQIERSGLPAASFDLISLQFVFHECPEDVILDILTECR